MTEDSELNTSLQSLISVTLRMVTLLLWQCS